MQKSNHDQEETLEIIEDLTATINEQAGQLDYLCNVIGELEDTLKSERLQTELSQERKDKA